MNVLENTQLFYNLFAAFASIPCLFFAVAKLTGNLAFQLLFRFAGIGGTVFCILHFFVVR